MAIFSLLMALGGIRQHLAAPGGIRQHPVAPGGTCQHLMASGGIRQHRVAHGSILRHTAAPGRKATVDRLRVRNLRLAGLAEYAVGIPLVAL